MKVLSKEECLVEGTFRKYGAEYTVFNIGGKPIVFVEKDSSTIDGIYKVMKERGIEDNSIYRVLRKTLRFEKEDILRDVPELIPASEVYENKSVPVRLYEDREEDRKEPESEAAVTMSNDGYIMNTESQITSENIAEYSKYVGSDDEHEVRNEGVGHSADEKIEEDKKEKGLFKKLFNKDSYEGDR